MKKSTFQKPDATYPHGSTPDFYVKCNVCKQVLKNWVGSTPCCGSIAYECDENGENESKTFFLYGIVKPK
jgi:hypothetical protein